MRSSVNPGPRPHAASAASCVYDTVQLVVWSGTGNSRRVAERCAAAARSGGAATAVRSAAAPSAAAADDGVRHTCSASPTPGRRLLGLVGPTHGFTAPWPVLRAAVTVPGVRGADAFVLVTRGAMRVGRRTLPGLEGIAAYLLFYAFLAGLPVAAVVVGRLTLTRWYRRYRGPRRGSVPRGPA